VANGRYQIEKKLGAGSEPRYQEAFFTTFQELSSSKTQRTKTQKQELIHLEADSSRMIHWFLAHRYHRYLP